VRVNFNFLNGIKLIWVVQMYREKYFSFGKSESVISSRCPASARGVRVVTNVERDAVDAAVAQDERH
jgi:hypothetical protein